MTEEKKDMLKLENMNNVESKSTDPAFLLLKEHCPTIIDAIFGKDALLKEAAESALSWNVFSVSGGDIHYAIRALGEMATPPINKIESTETRFIEIKRLITRARGDADTETLCDELLRKYASNIMTALENPSEHSKIKRAAEQALSNFLLGHKTADFKFIKKYIQDRIEKSADDIKEAIMNAELSFIETRTLIKSLLSEFKENEEKGLSSVIQSIQLGIAKYNIFFVLLLILALALSAEYLTQQALPLVAASIGAASAHLLAERNTVLGGNKKDKKDSELDS